MNLPELSIRRHVFAFMLNAVLILFGLIAYSRKGVDRLPYIEFPVISVVTAQKGANPDVVVERGDKLVDCAGAIADLYAAAGGDVTYAGKPYRPIYEQALAIELDHGHLSL